VLKEQFAISESAPPAKVIEAIQPHEILGLTLGLDVVPGMHPLAARDRFQDAWVAFCEEISAERPLVMLIEDIHWAEDLLLDLLERMVTDARAPLLLVVTARPEVLRTRPGWGARLPGTTLELDALSPEESSRMLDELLGGTLPSGLRDVVIQRAEGNPFFVEEVLGTLIDIGLLSIEADGWRLADLPPDFAVPDTVQAVVAARVDLLEQAEKQGLQAASVIGRIFWAGPVYELVIEGEPDLRVIEERDFIRRRSGSSIPGDREYAIKHALTREVAYSSLPKAARAHMHAAFARWLERIGAGKDEFASLLAHHYAEAVLEEDRDLAWAGRQEELDELLGLAIRWLRHAADLAIGRMEIDDGLALLDRAIELEKDPRALSELWHAIGRASILKFDGERFWTAMQASLETTDDRRVRAELYGELAFHSSIRMGMWKTRPDQELIQGWADRALELAEPGSAPRAMALLSNVSREPAGGESSAQEAWEIAEATDDVELRSFTCDAFAAAAMARGDYEDGCEWCRKRVDLVPHITDPDHISLIYGYSFPAFMAAGRLEEARELIEAHDRATVRLSAHHRLHSAHSHTADAAGSGRWEELRDLTATTEAAVAANVDTPCALENLALLSCALAHVHLGNDDEAHRLERVVEGLGKKGFEFRRYLDIEIAIVRGDLAEVERHLDQWEPVGLDEIEGLVAKLNALVALERREEIEADAPRLVIPGSYLEPFALRALGWARNDEAAMRQAIARFEAMGMTWFAEETGRWMGS
jgi:hypothetical protein